jgi:Mg2+-importing ATPase
VSTGCIMVIGLLIPYCVPIRNALKMARPENSFLGFLIVELLVYCLEVELVKALYMKIFRTWI